MFNGSDYHREFEETLGNLTGRVLDQDDVLGQLVGLEFTLWEAVKGAALVTGQLLATLFIVPAIYLLRDAGWVWIAACGVVYLVVITGVYWLFKLAAYWEISRHVRGRRFGDVDLPWLPSGTGYRDRDSS
jgi:hypothetical protein